MMVMENSNMSKTEYDFKVLTNRLKLDILK